jgi:integrase
MAGRREKVSPEQVKWEIGLKAAIEYGLAKPTDTRIGPIDHEGEQRRFQSFTDAIREESQKLTPQQLSARLSNRPARTNYDLLLEAQTVGLERPSVTLKDFAREYLRDREKRSTYEDIEKQVGLVVRAVEEATGQEAPTVISLTEETAYAFRDAMREKGNAISTIERRFNTLNAVLNHGKKRFAMKKWDNPFEDVVLPDDDGAGGEAKRQSLSKEEIGAVLKKLQTSNQDLRDVWLLMMFCGVGPNEARGVLKREVCLDGDVAYFEVKANKRRRLKTGERPRRIPLVGAAKEMMLRRLEATSGPDHAIFPRYVDHKTSNSLSAALTKPMKAAGVWVKLVKVPYSLRHTLKDNLRKVAPKSVQLLIFGHGHGEGGSADDYGEDDLLEMQAEYLEKALKRGGLFDLIQSDCEHL